MPAGFYDEQASRWPARPMDGGLVGRPWLTVRSIQELSAWQQLILNDFFCGVAKVRLFINDFPFELAVRFRWPCLWMLSVESQLTVSWP